MKTPTSAALLLALLVLPAADASADAIVFNAGVTTSGVFACLKEPACSASGDTVVLGSGDSAVTLTFEGVSTTIPITNVAQQVNLGTLSATANGDATTFPTRTNELLAIVSFNLTLAHSTPVPDTDSLRMRFGPGGLTELPYQEGGVVFSLAPGPNPPGLNYQALVYTLSPFAFAIPLNGSVDLTADVGAVPEPATMLLVGLGLAAAATRRRFQGRSAA